MYDLVLNNSKIYDNFSTDYGSLLIMLSEFQGFNSVFMENECNYDGGALNYMYSEGLEFALKNCSFINNYALLGGGAIKLLVISSYIY